MSLSRAVDPFGFDAQQVQSPSPTSSQFNVDHKQQDSPSSDLLTVQEVDHPSAPIQSSPKVFFKLPHKRETTMIGTDPTCLPPITASRHRTLILCFDGTGDQFDNDNSNIVEIFSMLKKNDKSVQMCYYQAGIGTYTGRHFTFPGMMTFSKKLDEAIAWALEKHVQDGYEFLMQNYVDGDKICLFGFSRGAYTARALAGMLHKVGLLPADNKQQIPFAWRMFKDVSDNGWKLSRQFKRQFSADVSIEFLGVFDTVSSVGFFGKKLPFTASNYSIRYFRHAMALDERRARFKVNHWTPPKHTHEYQKNKKSVRKGHEHLWKEPDDVETDVKEVWFSGCHADVGGGSVPNETKHSLARIPLRWMVYETFRTNSGILWDIDGLKSIGLDPDALYPEVIVRPLTSHNSPRSETKNEDVADIHAEDPGAFGSEHNEAEDEHEHHEHHDALSPLFDQLSLAWSWWILEVLPAKGRRQVPPTHTWKSYYYVNMGKGRNFPIEKLGCKPHIHRSVKYRLDSGKYKWKTRGDAEPIWVD